MGFQDVAFLPYLASVSTIFLKNRGRGESLMTTTSLKFVVLSKQWHDTCKILSLLKAFFVSVNFNGDHKTL